MKKIFGIVLTMIGIVTAILNLIIKVKGQISTSVIGGADGPTSIFLAGKVGDTWAVMGIFAGILLLAVGIVMLVENKDRGSKK